MKTTISLRILSLAVLVALMAAVVPSPVYAQAPTISGVTPQLKYNNVDNIITISGSNFDPTSQVSLGGTALLRLTQDVAEITARVPAGFTPGSYDVTVTTSTGNISCPAPCVTVSAPPSTSSPTPPTTRSTASVACSASPSPGEAGTKRRSTFKSRAAFVLRRPHFPRRTCRIVVIRGYHSPGLKQGLRYIPAGGPLIVRPLSGRASELLISMETG